MSIENTENTPGDTAHTAVEGATDAIGNAAEAVAETGSGILDTVMDRISSAKDAVFSAVEQWVGGGSAAAADAEADDPVGDAAQQEADDLADNRDNSDGSGKRSA